MSQWLEVLADLGPRLVNELAEDLGSAAQAAFPGAAERSEERIFSDVDYVDGAARRSVELSLKFSASVSKRLRCTRNSVSASAAEERLMEVG